MNLNDIIGYSEANTKAVLHLLQNESSHQRNETILNNFEYLVAVAVSSGLQKYHEELRMQIMMRYHIDIGDYTSPL